MPLRDGGKIMLVLMVIVIPAVVALLLTALMNLEGFNDEIGM